MLLNVRQLTLNLTALQAPWPFYRLTVVQPAFADLMVLLFVQLHRIGLVPWAAGINSCARKSKKCFIIIPNIKTFILVKKSIQAILS